MPAVFVHGVPETAAIWNDLCSTLARRDLIALAPPGFGAPAPADFPATSDAYLAWLIGEVERLRDQGPIDLIGHDWGGGHVLRLVMARPDLVRSWASDVAGAMDSEYVWHDLAQTWQTPMIGEGAIAMMSGAPRSMRVSRYTEFGVSPAAAESMADAFDKDMGRCILALYRSAKQPAMQNWGTELATLASRPGLVIIPTEDRYTGGERLARRSAERAKARVGLLPGRGHWWMCEDPAQGAAMLDAFFPVVPSESLVVVAGTLAGAGDLNVDGVANGRDIQPFVQLLP